MRWMQIECHEIWYYDDDLHVQRLDGLISLCPSCHSVKHFGLATVRGYADKAKTHLMKVNGWNSQQADAYIARALARQGKRYMAIAGGGLYSATADTPAEACRLCAEKMFGHGQ